MQPAVVGQHQPRVPTDVALRFFRHVRVCGLHFVVLDPVDRVFRLVVEVHLRDLHAHHVAGLGEVVHVDHGVRARAEGKLVLLAKVLPAQFGDLVFGAGHGAAEQRLEFRIVLAEQAGIGKRVRAGFAALAQHVLVFQPEGHFLRGEVGADAVLRIQVGLDGFAEVALVGVLGAAARCQGEGDAAHGNEFEGGLQGGILRVGNAPRRKRVATDVEPLAEAADYVDDRGAGSGESF